MKGETTKNNDKGKRRSEKSRRDITSCIRISNNATANCQTHRKENVQTKPSPPKDGLIYTKNEIETPTKAMTQSGSDCRVAALVREEVATGEEFGNGDD
jgi:hypothetical protein